MTDLRAEMVEKAAREVYATGKPEDRDDARIMAEAALDAVGFDALRARLTAAAPDLLEACQEAVEQIEYLHDKFMPTGTGMAVIVQCKAAISKAEGRE